MKDRVIHHRNQRTVCHYEYLRTPKTIEGEFSTKGT